MDDSDQCCSQCRSSHFESAGILPWRMAVFHLHWLAQAAEMAAPSSGKLGFPGSKGCFWLLPVLSCFNASVSESKARESKWKQQQLSSWHLLQKPFHACWHLDPFALDASASTSKARRPGNVRKEGTSYEAFLASVNCWLGSCTSCLLGCPGPQDSTGSEGSWALITQ